MLPGRSGHEILASVRQAKPSVPVIVLTARGEIEDRVVGLDGGAVDYLVKPFSLAELTARSEFNCVWQRRPQQERCALVTPKVNLLTRQVRRDSKQVRDTARDRASGGTGLGLAIVRAIADAHGGHVMAGKGAQGGARITLDLPGFTTTAGRARDADSASVPTSRAVRGERSQNPASRASRTP